MSYLTESQIVAIELLATYKYLTSSQFVNMGIFKKRGYLTNSLKTLLESTKPLLAKHDFSPMSGKLESFYFLTKYGKSFLMNEMGYLESQIKIPRGMHPIYLKDYYHRKSTIDFHVYFRQWIESNSGEIHFFNYYFDKAGNNKSIDKSEYVASLNKVQLDKANAFIPDANIMFSMDGQKHFYLFELHNGKDVKRLFEQLYIHILAISKRVVSEKYKLQSSHKVVVVCEFESVKNSVIQRLWKEENISHYINCFLFKTKDELEKDFFSDWTLVNGKLADFLF